MAPKPETIKKRMQARVQTALKTHRVAEAHFDAESGAGVIVAQNKQDKLVALFFDPATTRRFEEIEISAHQRLGLGKMMKDRLAEEKARNTAPHTMKPGDIFVFSFGATIRRVTFYRVTGVPHPQKISAVALPSKVIWGTIDDGNVVPDLEADLPDNPREAVFVITMASGSPYLKTTGRDWQTERGYPWNGKPERNMQD